MGKYLDIAEKVEASTEIPLPKNTGNTGNKPANSVPDDGVIGSDVSVVDRMIEDGKFIAVEICSAVLQANIWLAFDDDFNPGDGQAVFYAHELPMLREKTTDELRIIHKVKLAGRPGARVRK